MNTKAKHSYSTHNRVLDLIPERSEYRWNFSSSVPQGVNVRGLFMVVHHGLITFWTCDRMPVPTPIKR